MHMPPTINVKVYTDMCQHRRQIAGMSSRCKELRKLKTAIETQLISYMMQHGFQSLELPNGEGHDCTKRISVQQSTNREFISEHLGSSVNVLAGSIGVAHSHKRRKCYSIAEIEKPYLRIQSSNDQRSHSCSIVLSSNTLNQTSVPAPARLEFIPADSSLRQVEEQ